MTTITILKQWKDQLEGKLLPQRVERKRTESEAAVLLDKVAKDYSLAPTVAPTQAFKFQYSTVDRFSTYREKIIPQLRESGYGYFLACDSKQYQVHQEWCNDNCQDHCLPHCDVWQVGSEYPRAFANKVDAALFRLMFDADHIEGNK